jgi:lysophospholipase L1-like esterase
VRLASASASRISRRRLAGLRDRDLAHPPSHYDPPLLPAAVYIIRAATGRAAGRDGLGSGLAWGYGRAGPGGEAVLKWANYVALGDSLTAGRDDHGPGGVRIGWARRLAGILSARTAAPCALTNLAADGASVSVVLERQLPALAGTGLSPDLASVTVGMNDIRDPGFSEERFAAGLGTLLDGLAATGATVLTCTLPDIAAIMPLPAGLVEVARQRMRRASDIIREQAAERGAVCLDAWAMPGAADPELFGPDRIHPNGSGHQLMADAFAALLLTP